MRKPANNRGGKMMPDTYNRALADPPILQGGGDAGLEDIEGIDMSRSGRQGDVVVSKGEAATFVSHAPLIPRRQR